MNLKNVFAAATLAGSVLASGIANAQSMPECLSTEIVEFDGTITEAAIATPELSTLVDAVLAAGLDDDLATAEGITVLAPTNAAFDALPGGLLEDVVDDVDLLTAVLLYHVTPNTTDPRRFTNAFRRDTLLGGSIFYHRRDNATRVNDAAIDCQGVQASNGFVWIIDKVLLP